MLLTVATMESDVVARRFQFRRCNILASTEQTVGSFQQKKRDCAKRLPTKAGRTTEQIKTEIERLFGFFPNFFHPLVDTPGALESLWQQALTSYINNPLPAVF